MPDINTAVAQAAPPAPRFTPTTQTLVSVEALRQQDHGPPGVLPCYIDERFEGSPEVMVTFLDGHGQPMFVADHLVDFLALEMRQRHPSSLGPLYGVTWEDKELRITTCLGYEHE